VSLAEVFGSSTGDHGGVVCTELEGWKVNGEIVGLSRSLEMIAQAAIGGNPSPDRNLIQPVV
jgi:hypothetical protein